MKVTPKRWLADFYEGWSAAVVQFRGGEKRRFSAATLGTNGGSSHGESETIEMAVICLSAYICSPSLPLIHFLSLEQI